MNYGICEKCKKSVPATHEVRDGKVYLHKACPDCGETTGLVSSDAPAWTRKRELYRYDSEPRMSCPLNCNECDLGHATPHMVFMDVTNRCNMNCPICVANIPGMKFEFHPSFAYFEKVLGEMARWDPPPVIHLFGGEPTMRDDLFDIIDLAHKLGLLVYLVTNGLKLADEDYCRQVCERDVPVLLGFDGRDPAIYARMRKDPDAYEKKLTALENLKKLSRGRNNILMCCTARGINDEYIADLLEMAHEHRDHLKGIYFLPLTEMWENDRFDVDASTTIEDAEQIVDAAVEGGHVEFLPMGIQKHFALPLGFFSAGKRQTFRRVHPNCESSTLLLSDGERYRPLSDYLKRPLHEVADDLVGRAKEIEPKLAKLKPGSLWGRMLVMKALGVPFLKSANLRKLMKGSPVLGTIRLLGGLLLGKSLKEQFRRHTALCDPLNILVLPFEETHSLESERLRRCAAGFVFEDVETGEIKSIPVCAWWLYNVDILKDVASKYNRAVPAEA
jgi:uncharacterized radical SAM superfamily Fe-S cluster-containing enzyme